MLHVCDIDPEATSGQPTLVDKEFAVFADTVLEGGHYRCRFRPQYADISEYQQKATYGRGLGEVHNAGITVQKSSHSDLVEITQPNIFLLKPFAESRDRVSLAGH